MEEALSLKPVVWTRRLASICGASIVLLGVVVLLGWALHSSPLVQIEPSFPPMHRNTAVLFALTGIMLLGVVRGRPVTVLVGSALTGAIAGLTLAEYLLHVNLRLDELLGAEYIPNQITPGRMSPVTATCFLVVTIAFLVARTKLLSRNSGELGVAGLAIAAVGVTCCIGAISGTAASFAWGDFSLMAVHTGAGFLVLGIGLAATAWGESRRIAAEPFWLPIGACLFVLIFRGGLWQALSVKAAALSTVTLVGTIASALVFGGVVHLILKANGQREALRRANDRLEVEIAERRAAQEAAQSGSRLKDEFLANMSHEIRTPMTGVLGMIDLVLATDLSAAQMEHLELARSSADALLFLLNDLLDLSKIEAGRLELSPVDFSVRRTLADAVRILEMRATEKGLDLITEVDEDVPDLLCGDAMRLRQVLVNLVGNAVKFTDTGRVRVQAGVEAKTGSEVVLRVAVSDSGVGIPAEKHKLIFDPFRQVDGSTARRYGGTGLGLTICARLIRLMGGSVGLESEVGKGSTFTFTVRLGQATAAVEAPQAGALALNTALRKDGRGTASLRVLVAEDNIVNQKLMSELLKREGHNVTLVGNGNDAVTAAQSNIFDLALMDVQMPLMDGWEAVANIRQWERETGRRMPIIAMTAHAMKGDELKCFEAGMDDYLSKPIHFDELRAMLAKWAPSNVHAQPPRAKLNSVGLS